MAATRSTHERLLTTVNAVREVMIRRLEQHSLDPESEREMQMALEELEVMWEELQGQAEVLTREHQRYSDFFEYAPDAYVITDVGASVREAGNTKASSWQAQIQPAAGAPRRCGLSVRPIPLKKSGVAGLCWRIRALE